MRRIRGTHAHRWRDQFFIKRTESVMRNLFIIGMLLVGAFMAGWFKVNRDGERTTIEINRSEIRSDARKAIDRGREILDRRDQQYAQSQQYSDQQYSDQQYPNQQNADANQAYWPQEQLASQPNPWGTAPQQSYDAAGYPPQSYDGQYQNYYPQDQRLPNQPGAQANSYPQQPYYPPATR